MKTLFETQFVGKSGTTFCVKVVEHLGGLMVRIGGGDRPEADGIISPDPLDGRPTQWMTSDWSKKGWSRLALPVEVGDGIKTVYDRRYEELKSKSDCTPPASSKYYMGHLGDHLPGAPEGNDAR